MIEITGGGAPTLYTRFGDFISYAAQLNYHLVLVTNGSLLKKYETLLMASPIDWIRISLDAACPETHPRLHGIGLDMFNEILASACFSA